ncbi:MAG: phosphoribosylglycinamide formyltransferase [Firmicutes bacterium]|nr:phosphoribosylglycinamide formyltransferase [Bacillota bacterium]
MIRVAVLVSGGGTNLQALIDAQAAGKFPEAQIALVVSNRKKAYALERAKNAGIQTAYLPTVRFSSNEEYGNALLDLMLREKIDLIVLAGFLVVLSHSFVEAFPNRIINIHPSLIPSFCGDGFYGLKVHEEALNRGVKVTGATVHFVDSGTDTGPIILQKAVSIEPDDTPESLQLRVMQQAEWKLLPEAVRLFSEGKLNVEGKICRITAGNE